MAGLELWRRGNVGGGLLNSWEPFGSDFERIFSDMDRMLTSWRGGAAGTERAPTLSPPVEIDERDEHYVISMDIPGLSKEELNVEMQGNQLIISGERKREQEKSDSNFRRIERRYGHFAQVFTLPEGTDAERIAAHYENGVLQLQVPKSEAAKPRKIKIEAGKEGFLKKLVHKGRSEEAGGKAS